MKQICLLTAGMLLVSFFGLSQTSLDRTKIYEAIIQTLPDKRPPLLNETVSRIQGYDIDGDYNNWFFSKRNPKSADSSRTSIQMICVLPIGYSQTLISYFSSKNIVVDIPDLLDKVNNTMIDSLSKYLPAIRFIPFKKAPVSSSAFRNLLKRKKVIALSAVIFDRQNQIALIKIQSFSKKKYLSKDSSSIVILSKEGADWRIIDTLEEKR